MRNMRTWFIWCGDGTEMRNLTRADALSMAESMAETHARVLIGRVCAKHPRGIILGGIQYGRRSGVAEIRES